MGQSIECPDCGLHVWVSEEVQAKLTECKQCGLKVRFVKDTPEAGLPAVPVEDDEDDVGNVDDLLADLVGDGSGTIGGIDDMMTDWTLAEESGIEVDDATEAEAEADGPVAAPPRPDAQVSTAAPAASDPAPVRPAADRTAAAVQPKPKSPPKPSAAASEAEAPADDAFIDDPYDRIPESDIRLRIIELTASDVTLEFPSQLLELPAFRASMPMCCISSMESDPAELIARPFAWIDKLKEPNIGAREFSDRFAQSVSGMMSEEEFVQSMNPIELLPRPYNLPMPYYVARSCDLEVEVPCQVVNTDYGVGCRVRLPLGPVVLDWVARVNGVCGKTHREIQKVVMRQQSHEWRSMPEKLRQRLSAWFDWGTDERFLIYLPDSDFSRSDDGLAGVALTDRRLVYRKFKKQGVILLDQPGKLAFKRDGKFCNLGFLSPHGSKVKMVRLRQENAQILLLLLEGVESKVEIVDAFSSAGSGEMPD